MATQSRRIARGGRDEEEPEAPSRGRKSGSKGRGSNIRMPDVEGRMQWLFVTLPPLAALVASLGYLKAERWQESLQWGLMGVGMGLHALPEDTLPFGDGINKLALVLLAAGGALFGFWVFEQWNG